MSTSLHADLGDDELVRRLVQAGQTRSTAERLVRYRDDEAVSRCIDQVLGAR